MMQKNDCLILLEDGIYNLEETTFVQMLTQLDHIEVCAVEKDLMARHCQMPKTSITAISYEDFVRRCITHNRIFQL